jgi:hypothetical protein
MELLSFYMVLMFGAFLINSIFVYRLQMYMLLSLNIITDIMAMLLLLGYYQKIDITLDHFQSIYFVVLIAVAKTVFVVASNQRMYFYHIDGQLVDIEGKHNTRVIVISGLLITHFTLLPLYMSVL